MGRGSASRAVAEGLGDILATVLICETAVRVLNQISEQEPVGAKPCAKFAERDSSCWPELERSCRTFQHLEFQIRHAVIRPSALPQNIFLDF